MVEKKHNHFPLGREKHNVKKNNNTERYGIMVKLPGQIAAPVIYLDRLYQAHKNGICLDDLISKIADLVIEISSNLSAYTDNIVVEMRDFEKIKDRIIVNVINTERNREMLEDVPHTKMEDLSFIYKVYLGQDEYGCAAITIKNEHLAMWDDVTVKKLHEIAITNSKVIFPAKVGSLNDIITEMIVPEDFEGEYDTDPENRMYVVSNTAFYYGAATIFYSDVLIEASEKFGGKDLYVIPSSVNEVIVIEADEGMLESLVNLVRDANDACVPIEEQLSNHVYRFYADTHEIKIAEVA